MKREDIRKLADDYRVDLVRIFGESPKVDEAVSSLEKKLALRFISEKLGEVPETEARDLVETVMPKAAPEAYRRPEVPVDAELVSLVAKVRANAGYDVYLHAMQRGDLNDSGTQDDYTRATHNYRKKVDMSLTISENMSGNIVRRPGRYDIVAYGKVKDGGQQRRVCDIVANDNQEEAYYVTLKINADLRDGTSSYGRGPMHPKLNIICDEQLANQIVDYLKKNPKQYENFITQMLPASEFPNANKGFLGPNEGRSQDKTMNGKEPWTEIVFLDVDKVPEGVSLASDKASEISHLKYKKYGEFVSKE